MQIESILNGYKDEGYGTEQSCLDIRSLTRIEKGSNQRMGQFGVFIMAGTHILKEMFQLIQAPKSYFRTFENLIEWSTFVLSIIFVCDFTECHEATGLRYVCVDQRCYCSSGWHKCKISLARLAGVQ